MINTADLCKAINTAWDSTTLNATFQSYWDEVSGEFFVLNDQEAPEGQPWPYVVMDQPDQSVDHRSSSRTDNNKREVRVVEVRFNVHVSVNPDESSDPKTLAADLAEEIIKAFGGHPTTSPTVSITLDNGNHLNTRYMNDFGVRMGDDEYQWVVVYQFMVDVPVAI